VDAIRTQLAEAEFTDVKTSTISTIRADALATLRDKVMRMHAQTAMIENGFVHLPDAAPWLPDLHELTGFPNGRHDDQVDSTAQMLDWFKPGSVPSSNAGIFELTRMLAEEARGQQARRLRRLWRRSAQLASASNPYTAAGFLVSSARGALGGAP
jgi:hypothetical protein